MKLEHDFTVPAPVDEAWKVLLDVERVTPCMPGATLLTVDGDEFTGSVKVKVGPITVTYNGKAKFVERDESTHRAVIEASGRETRGSGTASATVNAVLAEAGAGTTRVTVETDLNVTGRPAQFGRGVMEEVGAKLVGQFADRLAAELASPTAVATASTAAAEAEPAAEPDPTGNSAKKTAAAKKTTAKKTSTAKKTTAKTTAEASSATTKTTAKKATAKKSTAKKAVAEKSAEPVAEKSAEPVAAATSAAPPTTQPPASQQTAPAGTSTGPRIVPPPARPAEPIDLLDVAGGSMAKRLAPLVGVLVVVLLLLRRRRRR